MIRVYGEGRGTGSFVEVGRGICEAAKERGIFSGFCPIGEPDFDDEEEPTLRRGTQSPIAVVTGAPGLGVSEAKALGCHQEVWLLLAPNSDRVPSALAEWIPKQVDGLLAPSSWAGEVLQKEFPHTPVRVCPHGVSGFSPNVERRVQALTTWRMGGGLRILHFSSTSLQRKGTRELVEGFRKAASEGLPGTLSLIVPVHALGFYEQMTRGHERILVLPQLQASREFFADFIDGAHLVAQPSRGEGFGLLPLEARALGVPALATSCTGHGEHFPMTQEEADEWGCVHVPHGVAAPIDDCPGAFAPTVSEDVIAEALQYAHLNYPRLAQKALERSPEIVRDWSWTEKSGPALVSLTEGKTS